jgi:protein involved in polysaccharide export with SLBB domain
MIDALHNQVSRLIPVVAMAAAFLLSAPVQAQLSSSDPLTTGPRGLTDLPAQRAASAASQPPAPVGTFTLPSIPSPPRGSSSAGAAGLPSAMVPNPLPSAVVPPFPPDPASALKPLLFGSQIFTGRFGAEPFSGFNPSYQVAIGDRISVRMWGAFTFEATQVVDVQGNIFIPNVGPVSVRGIRNADLNEQIEAQVKRTFRRNVGVYATLDAAQPVKVYVTGFVRAPGLYGGLSSDSVLYYLDRAGGIDPDRGSYLEVDILRGGTIRSKVNLYSFLIDGRIEPLQFQDGDTVVAMPRKHSAQVGGEVLNPYVFEMAHPTMTGSELLALARPKPNATHMSIVRSLGTEHRSEYHALGEASNVVIQDGDAVTVTSDKYPATILVHVEGAHVGERVLVLPKGARLRDVLAKVKPSGQAQIGALQLFRGSVAKRQKELIEASLRSLETYALTARSATSEEAALRGREATQILEFIDRARSVQPRGQVILANGTQAGDTLLEDGDLLQIPEQSNMVLVSGEVLFPNALSFDQRAVADDYIARSGGYNQGADRARVIVVHQDGSVRDARQAEVRAGDEIMVLPKIETKNIEITRGITQIVYQIAIAAKVLFGL